MKASSRRIDDVTILDLSGRMTVGEGSGVLRDQVHDLLRKNEKNILLNMADLGYIDSAGFGELVGAFTSVRSHGGELKLLNLSNRIRALLEITKFSKVFDVKDDEAQAVKAFTK